MVRLAHFDLDMCFAPRRRALFQQLNFQKCSEPVNISTSQNIGKTQFFATLLPFRAPWSSSDSFSSLIFFLLRFSSLALPTSAFSSVRIVGSWQDLWKRLLGKMSATDGASVYKISTRGVLARSLYKISIRGLLARSLHKVSLSEISIPDLSKTSPCKWSLGKISSWQDLFLARSLQQISVQGLRASSL